MMTERTRGAVDLVLTGAVGNHFNRFRPGWETFRLKVRQGEAALGPTKMQFFGNADETSHPPEFHETDGIAGD